MEWTSEALILTVRSHGETAAVTELFTRTHGRRAGLVHGGRSRRLRPVLQPGNLADAVWRGRLPDQLGRLSLDLRRAFAAAAMEDGAAISGLSSLCALVRLLPEHDPHPNLFDAAVLVLGYLGEPRIWPALMVRWELALLDELGFGLDLAACAATGAADGLAYVSPKTGRAVSGQAGAPYAARLLPLPAFLAPGGRNGTGGPVTAADVAAGFALTGHFIETRILRPRGLAMPHARAHLPALLAGCSRVSGTGGASRREERE